jgi:ABC-type dipeptide/oligopeptide/nickel transport system permease subunit
LTLSTPDGLEPSQESARAPQPASTAIVERRSWLWTLRTAWQTYRQDTAAVIALGYFLVIVALTLLAPFISPHAPNDAVTWRHALPGDEGLLLGADGDGRDVLSRLLWGGRVSLLIAIVPCLLAMAASLALGVGAGFVGGWVDHTTMRILDMFFAFPLVLLAILIASVLSPGLMTVMVAIFIALIPYIARVVRAATLSVKAQPYIEAARAGGATTWVLITRYVLPNVLAPAVVYTTTLMGLIMVVGAGLSFLGLGPQPPTADWGVMVADGRVVLSKAPHVTILPGIVIVTVAVSFAFIGDGMRDALDPRTRVR